MEGNDLLVADVADILGITPAAVRHAAVGGRLRVSATSPRGVRLFNRADVEEYRKRRESAQDDAREPRQ